MITIKIKTDNAAFAEESGTEVARILRDLAARIEGRDILPGESIALRDTNGNTVGKASAS